MSDEGATAPDRGPRPWIALGAALALTLTAYSSVVGAPFAWDDHLLIEEEARVHQLHPLDYFSQSFWRAGATRDAGSYFRPLVTLSYALDWKLAGGKPWLFHLNNLGAHLAACALLFAMARRGGAPPAAAAVASALFGLYPRATESVAWVSGRTDVFAAVFVLLALLLHRPEAPRARSRAVAGAALLGGLLCKEVALAGAAAVAAGEWAAVRIGEQAPRRALRNLVPIAIAVVTWASLRALATRGARGLLSAPQPPGLNRPLAVLQAVGQYALMLLDPLRPRLLIGVLGDVRPDLMALGGVLALALLALLVLALRRPPAPPIATGVVLALGALAMVSHLVPLNVATVATDRFLYLPAAGLALAAAVTWQRRRRLAPPVTGGAALALVVAFGTATYLRVADWTDEVRLWSVTVATTPATNPLPRVELGNSLRSAGRLEEAVPQYQQALQDAPGRLRRQALINLGNTLSDLGRLDEAREAMRAAIASGPELAVDRYNLGVLEARRLQFDAAEAELRRALILTPGYQDAEQGLRFVTTARQAAATLPPELPHEANEVRAQRAALWAYLGVPSRAVPLFETVVAAPDASATDLARAAAYLLPRIDRDRARDLLARVLATSVAVDVKAQLSAILVQRFGRGERAAF